VVGLVALGEGWLDRTAPDSAPRAVARLLERARERVPDVVVALDAGQIPPGEWRPALRELAAGLTGAEVP
jgi:hypothetical protein